MNITFRQMRLFLALADTGSVSGAAGPACDAAHRVHAVARSDRGRGPAAVRGDPGGACTSPTPGAILAATVFAIVDAWENFGQRVNAMHGLTRGAPARGRDPHGQVFRARLLGGFAPSTGHRDRAGVLNRDGVVQRLRENLDDLLRDVHAPADLDPGDHVFLSNPLVLVAWKGHRPAPPHRPGGPGQRALRATGKRGSGTRLATDRFFRGPRGFEAPTRLELGSNEGDQGSRGGPPGAGRAVGGMPCATASWKPSVRAAGAGHAHSLAMACGAPARQAALADCAGLSRPPAGRGGPGTRPDRARLQCRYSRRHDRHHASRKTACRPLAAHRSSSPTRRDWGPFHSPRTRPRR